MLNFCDLKENDFIVFQLKDDEKQFYTGLEPFKYCFGVILTDYDPDEIKLKRKTLIHL